MSKALQNVAFLNAAQVVDYAALRAYTGSAKTAYVSGYLGTAAPSGIAGDFTRKDGDATSAENGGTIIVDALGRRWFRRFDGPVNAGWFEPVGDGIADDTAKLQAAINAVGNASINGGAVLLPTSGRYYVGSNLTVLRGVDLVTDNKYHDMTDRLYWPSVGGAILLDSAATILLNNGAGLDGVLVYRSDMTFPSSAGLTAADVALYAGTAVKVMSAGAYIRHCTFLGFNLAIDTDVVNTPRGRIEHVKIDCTNGVRIDQDLGGWVLEHTYCEPILTSTDADNIRTGIGFEFLNRSDWTTVISCFAFQDTGFKVTDCNQIKFIGCMADHPTDGTDTYLTGFGFHLAGTSTDNLFIGCQTASHLRGFAIDTAAGRRNYTLGCRMWNMNSAGHGYYILGGDVSISGGRVGAFSANSGTGLYVNDAASNVAVTGGTHFYGLAAAIDTPAFASFRADESLTFESISGSIMGNEVMASIASAATLTLPNNGNRFKMTGTTTIGTIVGSNRLPGTLVTFVITDPAGLTISNTANLHLKGAVNAVLAQYSTITLLYETGNVWYEV